ncbi:TPA: hypothetical protein ACF37V_000804 [Vibrio parahaemolyticus]
MFKEPIKSSFATVQIGVAKADGKLSLTDTEVVFVTANPKQWVEIFSEVTS